MRVCLALHGRVKDAKPVRFFKCCAANGQSMISG